MESNVANGTRRVAEDEKQEFPFSHWRTSLLPEHVLSSFITEVQRARVDARSLLGEQVAIQVFAGGL